MMKTEETNLSNVLDNNSMQQILSYLSVKSLMKFRCVSKSWQSLTCDPSFIKLHQSKSHPQLFIMMYKNSSIQVYTPKYEFQGGEALYKVTIPWSRVAILKPINGLFSFIDILNGLSCIYNIGTRQVTPWVSIPPPPQTASSVITVPTYGFGFDPSTDKHKILCIWDVTRFGGKVEHIVQVFTLGENEWRTIDELPPVRPFGEAVYANGSIYRRNCDDKFLEPPDVEVILAFDVGTEKFRVIPIPDVIVSSHRNPGINERAEYLLEVDGHIALIDRLDADLSPSRSPFIYGMFTTPETLLPVLKKEKIAGAS